MKRVKLTKYICGYCGREFFEEEEAVKCEDFHAKIKRVAEVSGYDVSNKKKANRYPKELQIEMTDGSFAKYEFIEAEVPKEDITETDPEEIVETPYFEENEHRGW